MQANIGDKPEEKTCNITWVAHRGRIMRVSNAEPMTAGCVGTRSVQKWGVK